MRGRVAVHIRIGDNAVFTDVKLPAPVRVQSAGGDIDLITRPILVVDKDGQHFGKQLTGCFFDDVSVQVLQLDDLGFLAGKNESILLFG